MPWGPREWAAIGGLLVLLVSAVIVVRERLTKLEVGQADHARRLKEAEDDIKAESRAAGTTREQLAGMSATLEGFGARLDSLQEEVRKGMGELRSGMDTVLEEVRRWRGGRRGSDA